MFMLQALLECQMVIFVIYKILPVNYISIKISIKFTIGLIINCKVSVFADITGHCKKGLIKPYPDSKKIYLGNGILRQTRKDLFGKAAKNPW